jgi:hypothetical protein
MEPKRVVAGSFLTKRSGWFCLVVVAVVSLVGYWLDRLLVYDGLSRIYVMIVSNTLTGIVAGGLFLYVVRQEEARRDRIRERMRTVADLNHHIRNALQVIKLCGRQTTASSLDDRQLQLIKESADRIEWALREVLPKYPDVPITQPPAVGFAAVPSPASQMRAFSSRRQEDRLH